MRLGEERRNHCTPLLHICGPQHRALGRTPGIRSPGPHGTGSLGCTVKGSTLYRLRRVSKWAEGSSLWGVRERPWGLVQGAALSHLTLRRFQPVETGKM